MEHINIYSGKKAISRIVTSDSIKGLGACLEPFRSIFAVIDKNIPVNSQLMEILKAKNVRIKYIVPSEEDKTLETVMDICSWLLENGADRDAMILAVGGGITTDMTGFAACIYKRGVRFGYVPTTLLSQVDAAIGGKTGVNFEKYKNILGIIRQPAFTYICPQVLESLPKRDFLSGVAELLKTFMIEDNGNYQKAADLFFDIQSEFHLEVMMYGKDEKTQWRELLKKHRKTLTALIAAAANIKAGVVSRDQFEKGERRKLNLGHTFAHAIETLAQQRGMDITHGEAVSMGIIMAAELAERLGVSQPETINVVAGLAKRLEADFRACGLPIDCPFSIDEMADCMKKDKKAEGGKVHFILPQAIGDVVIVDLTVQQVVELMNAI